MEFSGELYKCGYCGFLLNSQCENLLDHQCLKDIFDESQHQLVEDDNKILTIVHEDQSQTIVGGANTGEAFEEKLIKYVQDRPPLYNAKLPLSQRTSSKKAALWMEIFNLFGGKISLDDIHKKWKYLKDRYNKAKKRMTEYRPSGSQASALPDPGFSYYHLLKFLDDGISHQQTISSIAIPGTSAMVGTESVYSPLPPSSCPSRSVSPGLLSPTLSEGSTASTARPDPSAARPDPSRPIKRKRDEPKSMIEKEIVSMLTTANKPTDGVDGFLLRLGKA